MTSIRIEWRPYSAPAIDVNAARGSHTFVHCLLSRLPADVTIVDLVCFPKQLTTAKEQQ